MNVLRNLAVIASLFTGMACSNNADDASQEEDIDVLPINTSANLRPTGASANDILSAANFSKLQIQIAYNQGFRPEEESVNNFLEFLQEHTFKEEFEVIYKELPPSNEDDLSLQEIANLEQENRSAYNSENTVAVYIYFADAPSQGDDLDAGLVTLGAVYRNTSMVIFERTLREVAGRSLSISRTDIETATLNHEFGHLFGLVNIAGSENGQTTIYTPMINDHEDDEADDHCNIPGCLMQAQLEFQDENSKALKDLGINMIPTKCNLDGLQMVRLLTARAQAGKVIVPDLSLDCKRDIQANGGK